MHDKPGECEHDWQPALLGPGLTPSGKEEHGFMCECGEVRTIADFWRLGLPRGDKKDLIFCSFRRHKGSGYVKPRCVELKARFPNSIHTLYWHGPIETKNGCILPPPTPDSSHVPDP